MCAYTVDVKMPLLCSSQLAESVASFQMAGGWEEGEEGDNTINLSRGITAR